MTDLVATNTNIIASNTDSLIAAWLDALGLDGVSDSTIDAYRIGLRVFADWLQETGTGPDGVTARTIQRFKASLFERYAAQTVNLRLSAVRSFFRWLASNGHITQNPAINVRGARRHRANVHKRDALTDAEVIAVLETCEGGSRTDTRDRAILALLAYCGLRTIEVHRANAENLKTRGQRLILEVHGKGRIEADEIAVIPVAAEPAIRAWLAQRHKIETDSGALFVSLSNRSHGQRLGRKALREMVKDRFDRAGVIGNKTTHSLRHTAITNAIRAAKRSGRSPLDVQRFARHASFDTTMAYVHEVGRLDDPIEDSIDYGA